MNVRFDVEHCGGCDQECEPGVGCFAGACTSPAEMMYPHFGHAALIGADGRVYVIGGFDGKENHAFVEIYDFETNRWEDGLPLPEPRAYFGAVAHAHGEKILVVGGSAGGPAGFEAYDSVWELDLGQRSWSSAKELPVPLSDATVTLDPDGRVWALWGFSDPSEKPLTGAYSLGDDHVWHSEKLEAPAIPRWGAEAVTTGDGSVYLIGGITPEWPKRTNAVDVLDLPTGKLTRGPELPARRGLGAAVRALDGRIIYFGGHNAQNKPSIHDRDVYALDPSDPDAEWSVVSRMPTRLNESSAVVGPDGRIYLFGGAESPIAWSRSVFVYDPAKDAWYL